MELLYRKRFPLISLGDLIVKEREHSLYCLRYVLQHYLKHIYLEENLTEFGSSPFLENEIKVSCAEREEGMQDMHSESRSAYLLAVGVASGLGMLLIPRASYRAQGGWPPSVSMGPPPPSLGSTWLMASHLDNPESGRPH